MKIAQKDASQAFKAVAAIKALSLAAVAIQRIQDVKWQALGIDRDSVDQVELSQLVFRDLSKQEIEAIRQGHEEEEEELGELVPDVRNEPDMPESVEEPGGEEQDEDDDAEIIVEGDEEDTSRVTSEGFRYVRGAQP